VRVPPQAAKIYLIGFMGAGKTTLGRLLAERLVWPFEDLDTTIERTAGSRILRIFVEKGEAYFRDLERRALAEAAAQPGRAIVASGGGTFCAPENRAIMQRTGITVWVDQPFDRIWTRRDELSALRPLLRGEQDFRALYDERAPLYGLATLHLAVGDRDLPGALDELMRLLAGWCG
jgi:shikimate kinase